MMSSSLLCIHICSFQRPPAIAQSPESSVSTVTGSSLQQTTTTTDCIAPCVPGNSNYVEVVVVQPSSLSPLLFDDHVEYSVIQISGSDPPPACSSQGQLNTVNELGDPHICAQEDM
jgi:hypothetical protein